MMVSKHRHALSSDSVQASTVIAAWLKVDGLLPTQQITKVFNDKASHAPTCATASTIIIEDD